jgi:hypothetical protein
MVQQMLHFSSEVCVWGKSEAAAYISLGCCLLSAAAGAAYWEKLSKTCHNGRLGRDNLCGQFPLIIQAFYSRDYLWSQQPWITSWEWGLSGSSILGAGSSISADLVHSKKKELFCSILCGGNAIGWRSLQERGLAWGDRWGMIRVLPLFEGVTLH